MPIILTFCAEAIPAYVATTVPSIVVTPEPLAAPMASDCDSVFSSSWKTTSSPSACWPVTTPARPPPGRNLKTSFFPEAPTRLCTFSNDSDVPSSANAFGPVIDHCRGSPDRSSGAWAVFVPRPPSTFTASPDGRPPAVTSIVSSPSPRSIVSVPVGRSNVTGRKLLAGRGLKLLLDNRSCPAGPAAKVAWSASLDAEIFSDHVLMPCRRAITSGWGGD